jgi:hypothetical protein
MKVVKIKELEDCFDGSFIKEVYFDEVVTKEFIFYMEKYGKLQYYPDFARPFYKIECKSKFILKGVEGNDSARLILYRTDIVENEDEFIKSVNIYKSPQED